MAFSSENTTVTITNSEIAFYKTISIIYIIIVISDAIEDWCVRKSIHIFSVNTYVRMCLYVYFMHVHTFSRDSQSIILALFIIIHRILYIIIYSTIIQFLSHKV